MAAKKAAKKAVVKTPEKFAQESREKFLDEIGYSSSENTYSFEFEKVEYTFKGFPTILEKTKIRAILNVIAPKTLVGVSSEKAIFGSGDPFMLGVSKYLTHSKVLLISPSNVDLDTLFVDENGESDEAKTADFGLAILMSELEFKKSKKKQL